MKDRKEATNDEQLTTDDGQPTKILVVEDEGVVARSIQNGLKKLGYIIPAVVSSGEEAIRRAQDIYPDLVLMDIRLGGYIDGVEAAKQIYSRFNIPVVYLTAYADDSTVQRAKITGSFGYVLKPFDIRELHSAIQIALYKHQTERELKEGKNRLVITLKSIGDGVIAIDADRLITFINPVAETLTGWKQKDALGKALVEIFNIVNEDTPFTGSADNIILIARDGRKSRINISTAPIQDNKGNTAGMVLVFRETTLRNQAEIKIPKTDKLQLINKKEHIPISLMVATSSGLIQEGIRKILESEKDTEIIAETSTYPEIIPLIEQKKPDVLFIDTAMSNLDTREILESIREKSAKTKVLLLLHTMDEGFIINAISSGVRGCLTDASNAEQFVQAIRTVNKDEIWAEIKVITKILARLLPLRSNPGFSSKLTKREEEVVTLVIQGYSNKKISTKLFISESTVKIHLNNIFKKLGISSRVQLISNSPYT